MTKTANITIVLIRNVAAPIELYKKPPKVSPKILAKPPKLPAMPCTAPWSLDPARLDNMDMTSSLEMKAIHLSAFFGSALFFSFKSRTHDIRIYGD